MVEPLADKPAEQSAAQWLEQVKSGANLNPIVSERRVLVGGLTGLQVFYKNISTGTEMESTYLSAGSKTYEVSLLSDTIGNIPEAIYKHMVKSFKVVDVR